MKKLQLLITLQLLCSFIYGLNVTIIESQSLLSGHDMDVGWSNVVSGMGHIPTIGPQSTLDNNTFFSSTDILIVSSGLINLPTNRINTILQFIQSGKPVYLQSEYLPTYTTNQAFQSIITSLGGSFSWNNGFSGYLQPMNVLGTFGTTNNSVTSLSNYWYSVSGIGDCNTISFLEYGGEYHGFQYIPPNPSFGSIITTTDQDWIIVTTSPQLMENIITHLISPSSISNGITLNLGNNTTLCQGESLTLDATNSNATYLWQDNSTNPTFTVTQQGSYWVEVTNNCGTTTDTINVSYNPLPTVSLSNDTLCQGETLTLDATTSNATYLWHDNSNSPTYNVSQQGTYWVQITVNNCSTTDTILIDQEECEVIFELPNVFTPNNDGVNDFFVPIISKGIVSMNIMIYNRWGNKIYETNNLYIEWNGQDVSDGTYFWIVYYSDKNGFENSLKGFVRILK